MKKVVATNAMNERSWKENDAPSILEARRFLISSSAPAVMQINKNPLPQSFEQFGFSANRTGGHMARSMMLVEMRQLHEALPVEASLDDYRSAIEERNVLGKPTQSSRQKSYRHLVELYGLDFKKPLFQTMRRLAKDQPADFPLLAMLCVYSRDPQLRHSFELIVSLAPATALPRERMEQHLEEGFPGQFSAAMKKSLAQNVKTTWTACGHLEGRAKKVRSLPRPGWAASTYAMFVGYLLGLRGEILLHSVFSRLVAAQPAQLTAHLATAASRHWLRLRHAGGVIEIDFSKLAHTE